MQAKPLAVIANESRRRPFLRKHQKWKLSHKPAHLCPSPRDRELIYATSKHVCDHTWATHTHTLIALKAQGGAALTQIHIWYQSRLSSVYLCKWTQT